MRAAFFRQPENRYNSAYFDAVRMPNKESEMRANLVPYASSPQWRKPDFPKDLFEPHGYPEQTWVRYEVLAGSLKLLELDDKGTAAEPAAFRRLCVETYCFISPATQSESSRLQAAVC